MIKVNLKLFGKDDDKEKSQEAQTPALDMEAYEKKLNSILESAQKKADEIIAEAQKKAESIAKQKVTKAATPNENADKEFDAYMNERVPVYLFKDNNKYKDDVPVTVNGETILIQRGKQVQIPRKFALVLENSQMQDAFAADHMTALADQYKSKEPFLI